MTSYSTLSIIFIIISLISIISLITLIIIIIKSPACLTKWTLFQLCIATLGHCISSLPIILIYGDNILSQASTVWCEIQSRITLFFFYPLTLFPIVLSFYIHGLLKHNLEFEKKWFWTFTGTIWILSLLYSSFIFIMTHNDENNGVMVSRLYCEAYKVAGKWNHYWVYQLVFIIFLISVIFSFYSTIVLYQKWRKFKNNQNRRTAIQLGYAVRWCVYMTVYTILLGCYMVSDNIIQQLRISKTELINYAEDSYHFGDFAMPSIGIVLLLVFGRNRTAAVCLPCCYYAPPNEAFTAPSFSSPPIETLEIIIDDNNNNDNENNRVSIENVDTLTNSIDIDGINNIKEGNHVLGSEKGICEFCD